LIGGKLNNIVHRKPKLKILQVGKFYFPHRGGIESVTQSLSEGLANAGFEVTVLCSMEKRWASHSEEIEGVKVVKLTHLGVIASQPITPSWPDVYRDLAGEADIIHIHCPNPLAELSLMLAPKNKPVVVTYHADVTRQKWFLPFYHPFQRAFLHNVDRIIVPTENHIKFSQVLPEFKNKCSIVPFGMDPKLMQKTILSEKLTHELQQKYGVFALFLGRMVSYKGLPFLIQAMKEVNHNLVLAGDGPERALVEQMSKSMGIADRIHFLGRIENQDLFKALYYASSMVILPSITPAENFGMVQLEAMAAAKPIIATDLPSGVPVVGDPGRSTLIVPPGNSELLAESMNYLFAHPLEAARMGMVGLKRFREQFTLNKMIEGHIKVYAQLLGIPFESIVSPDQFQDQSIHNVLHWPDQEVPTHTDIDKKKKVA